MSKKILTNALVHSLDLMWLVMPTSSPIASSRPYHCIKLRLLRLRLIAPPRHALNRYCAVIR